MRKKLLLILLAFACAVCCAFGLAACGEPEKYSCTLDAASTCVSTIQIGIKSENKAVTLSPDGTIPDGIKKISGGACTRRRFNVLRELYYQVQQIKK